MTHTEQTPDPFANPCIDTEVTNAIDYDAIGHPLALAEILPRHRLVAALQGTRIGERSSQSAAAEFNLKMGWGMCELALHPETSPAEAHDFFDDARIYAERTTELSGIGLARVVQARLLTTYLPAFAARREKQFSSINPNQISDDITAIAHAILAAPVHHRKTHPGHLDEPNHTPCLKSESERGHLATSVAILLLIPETGNVVFPASLREARSSEDSLPDRHEMYLFSGGTKRPLKSQMSSNGRAATRELHPHVVRLPFDELVLNAHADAKVSLPGFDQQLSAYTAETFQPRTLEVTAWVAEHIRSDAAAPEAYLVDALVAHLARRLAPQPQ